MHHAIFFTLLPTGQLNPWIKVHTWKYQKNKDD
jgi:hypothetical protein